MAQDVTETETVERNGAKFRTITEGKATILVPEAAGEGKGQAQVFYNPIQQFNRDLTVLAIKTYCEGTLEHRRGKFEQRTLKQSLKRKRRHDEGAEEGKSTEQTAPQDASENKQEATEAPKKPFNPTFKILDALSASGLRALRYAHELPFPLKVTANDLSASAAEAIKANITHNGLDDRVKVTNDDALALMYRGIAEDLSHKDKFGNPGKANKYDIIDLDPYGTAAPFLDAAVQSVREDGGLLCITCTDSAVWAGHSYSEKSYALYGGVPVHGGHSHEVGLRLIIHAVASSAARYGLHIEPLLSLSIDYYTKIFVRVTKSPQAVKFLAAKTMVAYNCDYGCGTFTVQHLMRSKPVQHKKGNGMYYKHVVAQGPTTDQNCQHCGFKTHLNGPMYGGPIHSQEFIQRLLDQVSAADSSTYGTLKRIEGMLRTAHEEYIPGPEPPGQVDPKDAEAARIDHYPFYIMPGRLAGALSSVCIPDDMIRGALVHLGYQVTRSHCKPGSIKTDAPWSTIWFIMTEWIRQKAPVKEANIKPASAAYKILSDAGIIGRSNTGESAGGKSVDVDMGEVSLVEEDSANTAATLDASTKEETAEAEGKKEVNETEQQPQTEAELRKTLVFNEALASLGRQTAGKRIVRFPPNPESNWGPLTKARAQ
jgi:tRNA (guanine26-N2/guanine27-N2)-dimethyltransferase